MNNENIDTPTPNEGTTTAGADRPIGFWLRVVDATISEQFAAAFAQEGVTRRDWMLLTVIDGEVAHPAFAERLARTAERHWRGGKRFAALEERGWIEQTDDGWTLTADGRAAKERLGAIVADIRARVAGAVSPEDFETTMTSLEAIARELGWDESHPMPRRRGPFGRGGFGRGRFERGESGRGEFGRGRFGFAPVPPARGEFDGNLHRGRPSGHGPREAHEHCGESGHRGHGHDHGHGHGRGHGHGHGHRRAERAFERGFEAGFRQARATADTVTES